MTYHPDPTNPDDEKTDGRGVSSPEPAEGGDDLPGEGPGSPAG